MVTQPSSRGFIRLATPLAVLTAVAVLSLAAGCDKVPLLAPSGTVITLFPSATSVPINGSIEIVATVIENGVIPTPPSGTGGGTTTTGQAGAGTPVHNGTRVTFTTTIGRVEPTEAQTHNGQVHVRFFGNGQSGQATITAFSGGASGRIENLPVGSAAAGRIVVTTAQSLGPAGGSTDVIAQVEDQAGTPLAGIPVTFRTTAGTLSSTSAATDGAGRAVVRLTTNTNATVTATAGSQSQTFEVTLGARLINSVTANPQSTTAGTPVTITVTSGTGANISDATIDFGDGSGPRSLGAVSGTTSAAHAYNAPGSYLVTVTARDALGNSQIQTTTVSIGALPVTLSASPNPASPGTPVTFTAAGVAGAQVREYRWVFGDGASATTTGPQASHPYSQRSTYTATVQVIGLNGSIIGSASTGVTIQGL